MIKSKLQGGGRGQTTKFQNLATEGHKKLWKYQFYRHLKFILF